MIRLALALLTMFAVDGMEPSWPRFRGSNGSGVGVGCFPTHFGPDTNVAWKVESAAGHGSLCVWGDRVFLTGFSGGLLEVICLDRKSGTTTWKRTIQPGHIERGSHLSNPATATPATDGLRVYVYFGSFGLAAFSLEGEQLWTKPLPIPVTQHGAGASPVVADGRVFMSCDQDTGSYLLCVAAADGKTL